jgi:hypothetical protein
MQIDQLNDGCEVGTGMNLRGEEAHEEGVPRYRRFWYWQDSETQDGR